MPDGEILQITYIDDDGSRFVIIPIKQSASIFNPSHAKNFAKYLHRAGAEKPNDRTRFNCRWLDSGESISADFRTERGGRSLKQCIDQLVAHWKNMVNDVCYIFPAEDGHDMDIVDDAKLRSVYEGVWSMTGIDAGPCIRVTHQDQETPAHVHHVRFKTSPSLYEALVAACLIEDD